MSVVNISKRRALRCAVSTVAISLPIIGFTCSRANADLTGGQPATVNYSDSAGDWPTDPLGNNTQPVYTTFTQPGTALANAPYGGYVGSLAPAGGTAAFIVQSETITPTTTFTLGGIDLTADGAGGGNMTLAMFALPSPPSPDFSASYNLSSENPTDLLGGGSGLTFHFYGSGGPILAFGLNNGQMSNDQIVLQANQTYAVEVWSSAAVQATQYGFIWDGLTNGADGGEYDPGGQAFTSPDASLNSPRSTLDQYAYASPNPLYVTSTRNAFGLALYAAPPPSSPPAWVSSGSGDWNAGGNWGGIVPNGIGMEADLFGSISSPQTVYTNVPVTVGTIHFNNSNTYVVTGAGSLTIQANPGTSGLVQVDQGTQELDLPVTIASNTTFNVSGGATLLVANPLTVNAGNSVTQTGDGTVTYQSIVTLGAGSSLSIGNATIGNTLSLGSAAKVALTPSSGAPNIMQFNNLILGTAASVDLGNNQLVINYSGGSDPVQSIVSYLASGYTSGGINGWGGSRGIVSSTVASLNASQSKVIYSVGYADGADGVVSGLASGQIEIIPTIAGDAKLAGNVVFGDFQLLAANFGKSAGWDGGNFTYGSIVNFGDFQLLAQNFGANSSNLSASQLSAIDGFAALGSERLVPDVSGGYSLVSVPEPATLALLSAAGLSLLGRRRRQKRGK